MNLHVKTNPDPARACHPPDRPGAAGTEACTARNRGMGNAGVALRPGCGLHHLPRPEDHPAQPWATRGLAMPQVGDRTPVTDLPPRADAAGRHAASAGDCRQAPTPSTRDHSA